MANNLQVYLALKTLRGHPKLAVTLQHTHTQKRLQRYVHLLRVGLQQMQWDLSLR